MSYCTNEYGIGEEGLGVPRLLQDVRVPIRAHHVLAAAKANLIRHKETTEYGHLTD